VWVVVAALDFPGRNGEDMKKRSILIAGPTASGKSGLAIDLASGCDGVVINADSMQVYDVLRVLTARPSDGEMADMPHLLFGHIHPSSPYSVAHWLEDVTRAIDEVRREGQTPVLVGGTGLYFKALLQGLSAVPEIDETIRKQLRERSQDDLEGLHSELQALDPVSGRKLHASDTQRIVRALEVVMSTGKTLPWWQMQRKSAPWAEADDARRILLMPERQVLHQRIAARFHTMVDQGALEEVQQLLDLGLNTQMPAMRAIGVKQLAMYLEGAVALPEAIELAIAATRQYAKRQSTFFRHQFEQGWEITTSGNVDYQVH
jgi:tRNA dimethylallyltransferase